MPYPGTQITSLLPALRRYARAATGGAAVGDAALVAAMPALATAAVEEGGAVALRQRLLAALVASLDAYPIVSLGAACTLADALAALPTPQRHMLLLTVLEEFEPAEAAAMIGLPPAAGLEALQAARRRLAAFRPARVLIIEDEPLARLEMEQLVHDLGHALCGAVANEDAAWETAQRTRPDLVLADIDLGAGGSGLVAAQRIAANDEVTVVLVTGRVALAHPAEAPSWPVVRKPWHPPALSAAIGRALQARHARAR